MAVSETGEAFYDRAAEYVAVLIPAAWEGVDAALAGVLAGLETARGPVVDVGAAAESAPPCWREPCPMRRSWRWSPHRAPHRAAGLGGR